MKTRSDVGESDYRAQTLQILLYCEQELTGTAYRCRKGANNNAYEGLDWSDCWQQLCWCHLFSFLFIYFNLIKSKSEPEIENDAKIKLYNEF